MPPHSSSTNEQIEVYNRRREDALAIDVAGLQLQIQAFKAAYDEGIRRLTAVEEAIALEKQERLLEKARAEAAFAEQMRQKDFVSKIGSAVLTLFGIALGAWLSYAIPAHLGKR